MDPPFAEALLSWFDPTEAGALKALRDVTSAAVVAPASDEYERRGLV